jgi:hypothetical protein
MTVARPVNRPGRVEVRRSLNRPLLGGDDLKGGSSGWFPVFACVDVEPKRWQSRVSETMEDLEVQVMSSL